MKWLIISVLLLLPFGAVSSETDMKKDTVQRKSRYDRKLERYRTRWDNAMPSYSKLQYGGGIGMVALGFGWDYGRHDQWETDVLIGFVPRISEEKANVSLTLRQNYLPWKIYFGGGEKYFFEPLNTGLYVSRIIARDFWGKEPSKYGGPYYRFATAVRFHPFIGQRIGVKLGKKHLHKSISFYYELSTNDLYLVSLFTNRYLSPVDIISLSFGLKFQLF